jgi:Lar family restriction alleviation protein
MTGKYLKRCPFCGGKAERIDIEDGENAGGSCIVCTQCNTSSNVEFEFKENFVSNWNRRVSPTADAELAIAQEENAKLREILEKRVREIADLCRILYWAKPRLKNAAMRAEMSAHVSALNASATKGPPIGDADKGRMAV